MYPVSLLNYYFIKYSLAKREAVHFVFRTIFRLFGIIFIKLFI